MLALGHVFVPHSLLHGWMVYLVREDLKAVGYGTEILDTEKLIVALYQLFLIQLRNKLSV